MWRKKYGLKTVAFSTKNITSHIIDMKYSEFHNWIDLPWLQKDGQRTSKYGSKG